MKTGPSLLCLLQNFTTESDSSKKVERRSRAEKIEEMYWKKKELPLDWRTETWWTDLLTRENKLQNKQRGSKISLNQAANQKRDACTVFTEQMESYFLLRTKAKILHLVFDE